MNPNEFERRLRALAKREGLTFATFATMHAADRDVLVATIADSFAPGHVYRERDVNEALKSWLGTVGSMIETDHVHIRRWLIDTGVLDRTPDCAEYRLSERTVAEIAARDVNGVRIDAAAVVAATRREAGEARAQRRRNGCRASRSSVARK